TYLYDKVKRPEKVMVTRDGVAYMYRLDNPLLPEYLPGSLLSYYLARVDDQEIAFKLAADGEIEALKVGDFGERGEGFSVNAIAFDPEPSDPMLSRFARYLRD